MRSIFPDIFFSDFKWIRENRPPRFFKTFFHHFGVAQIFILAEPVERWSLFRIMEWLRSIELAEFATNLRGTGVHGGLITLEPGFSGEHFATLLQMSQKKTLLRKHLQINFETLLDDEQLQVTKILYYKLYCLGLFWKKGPFRVFSFF